jgi:hypothetical protein
MKRLAPLILIAATAAAGCRATPDATAGDRDDLLGWYRLPNRHYQTREILPGPGTVIPVFKRDGVYYSTCRGGEVPLKPCPQGLEWGIAESGMRGTTIGIDTTSKEPFIIIEDANAQYEGDCSTSGERQFMTRIEPPSGLLDPAAEPPASNDRFIGCYQPVWFPVFRWIVRKDDDTFRLEGQRAGKRGWEPDDASESATLEPLRDEPGFAWGRKKEVRLVFNRELVRYECVSANGVFRMPLARVSPAAPPGTGYPSPPAYIGIPSWH